MARKPVLPPDLDLDDVLATPGAAPRPAFIHEQAELALQLHIAHARLSRTTFCGCLRHFPLNVPS
jgi:hypothetical protein